jgi:Flp pilus assembly protein TadG
MICVHKSGEPAGRHPVAPGKKRSGIAAVEFAAVAPVLAVIMLGMFELSRAMMVLVIVNDAARKGCRVGALAGGQKYLASPNGAYSIETQVNNILSDNGIPTIDDSDSTTGSIVIMVNDVVADPVSAQPGDKISVQVSVPYKNVFWVSTFFVPGNELESQMMVMMRQG